MGYPIHAKKTPKGIRYRVWSSIVDSYISDEMTEAELRDFELTRQSLRAVEDAWRSMDRDVANTGQVRNWEREREEETMSDKAAQKMHERHCQNIGAEVDVELQTQKDGMKILTVRIKPVQKSG